MNTDNLKNNTKIGFIGLGNMATALIKSLIKNNIEPNQIFGSDKNNEKIVSLKNQLDINTSKDNNYVIKNSDIIFLCIKPQGINDFKQTFTDKIKVELKSKIIVSILAGIKLKELSKVFDSSKIIRLMPNINCQVGLVAGGYSVTKDITYSEEIIFLDIAQNFGVIKKIDEPQMDALTAVSGSGPAFVAHIMKSFYDAGKDLGLLEKTTKELVNQTFIGTIKMLESGYSADELIEMISSPNGTTVAGRNILENSDVKDVIKKTLKATRNRSVQMGK